MQLVELRTPGVIEHHKLAIEYMALRQAIEHLLVADHPVAIARDQLAANCVGRSSEAVELGLEDPVGMNERLGAPNRIDQHKHAGLCNQIYIRRREDKTARMMSDVHLWRSQPGSRRPSKQRVARPLCSLTAELAYALVPHACHIVGWQVRVSGCCR
jgi:hypothetical protein